MERVNMDILTSEKIRIITKRQGLTLKELAARLHTPDSNIAQKLRRNNFSESDLRKIAHALNCEFETVFTMKDTGETL
jgi:transcriptional regulator with XRE-family HTH domain